MHISMEAERKIMRGDAHVCKGVHAQNEGNAGIAPKRGEMCRRKGILTKEAREGQLRAPLLLYMDDIK